MVFLVNNRYAGGNPTITPNDDSAALIKNAV